MWKAFAELEEMGMLGSARPRMIGVQVEGCAPLVRAFLAGRQFAEPWADATTEAAGLRVPSTVGDFLVLEAIVHRVAPRSQCQKLRLYQLRPSRHAMAPDS